MNLKRQLIRKKCRFGFGVAESSVLTLTADLSIVFYKLNPHKFGVFEAGRI